MPEGEGEKFDSVPKEEIQKSEVEKSAEEIEAEKEAMGKVVDLFDKAKKGELLIFIEYNELKASENLQDILKEGIVSRKFAKKIGKEELSFGGGGASDDTHVCVWDSQINIPAQLSKLYYIYDNKDLNKAVANFVNLSGGMYHEDFPQCIYYIDRKAVEPKLLQKGFLRKLGESEIRYRIPPKAIIGVGLWSNSLDHNEIKDLFEEETDETFRNLKEEFEFCKKSKIPVYTRRGGHLIWPEKMTNEEIKKYLEEKEKSNKDSGQAQ